MTAGGKLNLNHERSEFELVRRFSGNTSNVDSKLASFRQRYGVWLSRRASKSMRIFLNFPSFFFCAYQPETSEAKAPHVWVDSTKVRHPETKTDRKKQFSNLLMTL